MLPGMRRGGAHEIQQCPPGSFRIFKRDEIHPGNKSMDGHLNMNYCPKSTKEQYGRDDDNHKNILLSNLFPFSQSWASLVAQTVTNLPAMQVTWVGRIPWRRAWQPSPVFLLGEFHGQGTLVGYSPWGLKESDTTEQLTLFSPSY